MTDSKQHLEHVTTIADVLHKGIYSDAVDEADIVAAKDALENLEEQLDTAQQTLLEVAQEGYERVQQKRYEELLEQLEAALDRSHQAHIAHAEEEARVEALESAAHRILNAPKGTSQRQFRFWLMDALGDAYPASGPSDG